jgi:hypothetical protein
MTHSILKQVLSDREKFVDPSKSDGHLLTIHHFKIMAKILDFLIIKMSPQIKSEQEVHL